MTVLRIQRLLREATSLDLSPAAVETAMRKRMKQRHVDDLSAYAADAALDKEEIGALIDLVVVPETWFFRDAEAFSAAAGFARRIAVSAGRAARILSVPCASGEEPYSLAIALLAIGVRPDNFIIDAVDVSPQALRHARKGMYKRNAFRSPDLGFRDLHFTQHGDRFALSPEIRRLVHFRRGNLLTLEPLDGQPYDIIFCRNLLIYFDAPTQALAIRKLHALLRDDGMLFCGYAEAATFCLQNFTRTPFSHAFALQKKRDEAASTRHAAPPLKYRRMRLGAGAAKKPALPSPAPATAAVQDDPDALLEKANRLADQGALDKANQAYRTYLELVPDSAQAHFMLGLLSEQCDDDKSAEEFLRRAAYLDPDHYEALCHLALLAARLGNETAAHNYRKRAARVFERRSGERKQ